MSMPPVIVLGLSPTGLYAVREAARAGAQVWGVADGFACGRYSRHLRHSERYWQIASQEELLSRLVALPPMERRPVLLPTSDRFIEFIGRHAGILEERFDFAESYHDLSQQLMDKRSFHQLCGEHNVATPGVWEASGQKELLSLATDIPYPCILKPDLIHRAANFLKGKKVLLARDKTEYRSMVESIPEETGGWLVQEVIPGAESNITLFGGYFDRNARPLQTFTARKLRQYPVGFGSASLVRSEFCQETLEKSIGFLTAMGFKGICGTEFKKDPRDGRLKIIEINPRPTLWFQITNAAGKRIVETACRDLAELPTADEEAQVEGLTWRYSLKDMHSSFFYRFRGESFVFPPPEIGKRDHTSGRKVWPVYDPSDPLPSLAEPLQFVNKLISRFTK